MGLISVMNAWRWNEDKDYLRLQTVNLQVLRRWLQLSRSHCQFLRLEGGTHEQELNKSLLSSYLSECVCAFFLCQTGRSDSTFMDVCGTVINPTSCALLSVSCVRSVAPQTDVLS